MMRFESFIFSMNKIVNKAMSVFITIIPRVFSLGICSTVRNSWSIQIVYNLNT